MDILGAISNNYFRNNYNKSFLKTLEKSFEVYLKTSSRSNKKLKILHGFISSTLQKLLGLAYEVKSLGIGDDKESSIKGRYMDKKVDIAIYKEKKVIAGIAVKFVMSNYSQNSNNYFENMLGETANIRSNNIPYFQIFIIPDKIPYYDKNKNITKYENVTIHNLNKYVVLSNDNTSNFMHTPNKTFIALIHLPDVTKKVINFNLYKEFYIKNKPQIQFSNKKYTFGPTVVYNKFDDYIKKIAHLILSY